MTEGIKIANGWVIHIQPSPVRKGSYTIERIEALFGHGVWFNIDTSKFTQENWDMFHDRVREVRNEIELDKHYNRMSEGFIPKEMKTCE